MEGQHRHGLMKKMGVRFLWACDAPREVERWGLGYRLLRSRDLLDVEPRLLERMRLPRRYRFPLIRRLFGGKLGSFLS